MNALLQAVWEFLNSPLGITLAAAVVLYVLQRLRASYPQWAKYEGAIIEAIKYAEKTIPDDHPDRAVARFDTALAYVLRLYREANKGRLPGSAEVQAIKEGIRVKHAQLEAAGAL